LNWAEIWGAFGAGVIMGALRGYSERLYLIILLTLTASLFPLTIIGWLLQVPPVEPNWLQTFVDVIAFLFGFAVGKHIMMELKEA